MMSKVVFIQNGGELAHHGILGQKWGKKSGPPYPLDASKHTPAEKKAGTKGWTKEAKKEAKNLSDDELRKAINRKNLENRYNQYATQTGRNKELNENIKLAAKTARTAGKVASAVSTSNRYKGIDKISAIEDDDNLSKKEKKLAKKELKEFRNDQKAAIVGQISNQTANGLDNSKFKFGGNNDLSKMTDAKLKKAVDRMALEVQYDNLYTKNVGRQYTMAVLDTVGDVAAAVGSALTIAMAIKALKKG